MDKLIAACGLNCAECEAFIATQENDDEKLAAVAKKWSEQYGSEIEASQCICDGCRAGGRLSTTHAATCELRVCAEKQGVPTCAHCEKYGCETLTNFVKFAPVIGEKLEAIRDSLTE
jgi:hypothetical protein